MRANPHTAMSPRRRPAVLLLLALASLSLTGAGRSRAPVAHVNPAVTINVDAATNRHPIDPRIYGVAFADPAKFADLGVTINRWGGNATSRHNWEINTTNRVVKAVHVNLTDGHRRRRTRGSDDGSAATVTVRTAHGAFLVTRSAVVPNTVVSLNRSRLAPTTMRSMSLCSA